MKLSLTVVFLLVLAGRQARSFEPIECFPLGCYGLAPQDSAFSAGRLSVPGRQPVYMAVVDPGWDADDCEYASPRDVFRLVVAPAESLLLAGCSGDFNGDKRLDYALLFSKDDGSDVRAWAFLSGYPGFTPVILPPIFDKMGFDEDPSWPPGPFCLRRPESGRFHFETEYGGYDYEAVGDLFSLGWSIYAWSDTGFVEAYMAD